MTRPRVLMVTGSYAPETSGASLQCQRLVRALGAEADFLVLTTTTDASLPARDRVDDVEVWRVRVDPDRVASKTAAALRMTAVLGRTNGRFDLVHLHGFSQKSILLMALARTFGKRVLIKLTSVGHDDGLSMRARGGASFACYRRADRWIGVGPRFEAAHREAGLDVARFRLIPNGVDLSRFSPVAAVERPAIRARLGLPPADPVVLFVGFFSHEKRPDLLYRAWRALAARGLSSTLVLIGATHSTYYEIDPEMAASIKADAAERGLLSRLVFVERTAQVEDYYRAADAFALPTVREGMPNALLEAMACGVPPVVTRLDGVTDWIVEAGTGRLVPANDEAALADALADLLRDPDLRRRLGQAARASVARRFDIDVTARRLLAVYQELLAGTPVAAA